VDLDYYKDPIPDQIGMSGEFVTIPTISSGLAQLESKLTALLDKVQALPLDDTMQKIGKVADEARVTLKRIESTVTSVGPDGAMQGDLLRTMDELRATLRSLTALSNGLDDKPSSLIFGRDSTGNPQPKAPKR
jgi:paraquat-inducible protein B